jgi:murein DD-endopeptidase MepM/ murein hydrolase activator NlpD
MTRAQISARERPLASPATVDAERRRPIGAAVIAVALVLAGCTRQGPPAPVTLATGGRQQAPEIAAIEHPDSIIVQPGETLYSVSRHYGVPLRSLIEANNLQPPFGLVSGRRLILPQVRTYTVQQGDTLLSLSRHFGVDASTLARTNDIPPPYPVKLGQTLILPPPVQTAGVQAAGVQAAPGAPAIGAASAVIAEPLAAPPASDAARPLPASNIGALPPVAHEPVSRAAPSAAAEPVQSAPAQIQATSVPPPSIPHAPYQSSPVQPPAPLSVQPPGLAAAPPASVATAPEPPSAFSEPPHNGRGFAWPVRGPVLVGYGPGANGTQNDGVNIAAPLGTPVLAANDGVVAYAGNELRGFGNLILLKHVDGWTTAYAHCDSIAVKRGDRVKRGQAIGRVGATGAVGEPQLHFELRRGTRALDPQSYLPPISTASAG